MKLKFASLIIGLLLLYTIVTAASLPLDVIAVDNCIGGGIYNITITAINNTKHPVHIDEAKMVTPPNQDTIYFDFPGLILAKERATIVLNVPATQKGIHVVTISGFIVETQQRVSDSSDTDISGDEHCPGGTPTSEPTNSPTDNPTETPTNTPTETFTPSITPTGTITPGMTVVPTDAPTESPTTAPTLTPLDNQTQQTQTPVPTVEATICPECGAPVCEFKEIGFVTEYESNITKDVAYLTVLLNGDEVEGGTSHRTEDGTQVSFTHGGTTNPHKSLTANGDQIGFFEAPCSQCLLEWGNRIDPQTGDLQVLFLDGGTKWDFMVAVAALLNMNIHDDFDHAMLRVMAEGASMQYRLREPGQTYVWVTIEER